MKCEQIERLIFEKKFACKEKECNRIEWLFFRNLMICYVELSKSSNLSTSFNIFQMSYQKILLINNVINA